MGERIETVQLLTIAVEREDLRTLYQHVAGRHAERVFSYLRDDVGDLDVGAGAGAGAGDAPDAGFDLYAPTDGMVPPGRTTVLGMGIHAAMTLATVVVDGAMCDDDIWASRRTGRGIGYWVLPRSSLAAKTTVRLGNSPGLIDAGYRGEIKAILDNSGTAAKGLSVSCGETRLVQLCGPRLDLPLLVNIVADRDELGATERGGGGLGSTGGL